MWGARATWRTRGTVSACRGRGPARLASTSFWARPIRGPPRERPPSGSASASRGRSCRRTAPDVSKAAGDERGAQDRPNYHVAALTRGLRVLRVLAEAGSPLPLTALEERAAIPKSTLVRLLSVLAEADYVVRVDETPSFWLGPSVMPLAESYSSALDVSAYAEEVLKQLAASSGQTANVAILDGSDVVHLCVVEPDRPIRFRSSTGSRDGAYRTGLGKALLAFAAPDRLSDHLPPEPFPALTKRTITTRRAMLIELEQVRRAGYAFDNEEGDVGVCCLAVPIRQGSEVVAAVTCRAPPASSVSPQGTNCYRPSGKLPFPGEIEPVSLCTSDGASYSPLEPSIHKIPGRAERPGGGVATDRERGRISWPSPSPIAIRERRFSSSS